jgi:hypothetical protein
MRNLILLTFLIVASVNTSWAKFYGTDENLFNQSSRDNYRKTPAQVHAKNLAEYEAFLDLDIDEDENSLINKPGTKYLAEKAKFLSPSTGRDIINVLNRNPVVSMNRYYIYDPENLGIGFCFGRAMFVHLELMQRGLDSDSSKKAFVVGSMQTPDGGGWGWHVTTIVQSKNSLGEEIWLALDPITGVVPVEQWYQKMYDEFSTDKKLKLYITSSGRFGPTGGEYDQQHIKDDFYNQYFLDMLSWFDSESKQGRYDSPVQEYGGYLGE